MPCCLGKLNEETRYLLKRFRFQEPQLLTDARITVGEVTMDAPTYISPDTTIFECLQQMQQGNRTYCGVVDQEEKLIGMVTKSDRPFHCHHGTDAPGKHPQDPGWQSHL